MTPPAAMPPAIIQSAPATQAYAGQAGSPPGTVQIPIRRDDLERGLLATHLAVCAGFTSPHGGTNLTNGQNDHETVMRAMKDANLCVSTVEDAVRNGTITDAPAMALALRNDTFISPQGEDKIAGTLDDIASLIDRTTPDKLTLEYNPSLAPAPVSTAFTPAELGAATIVDGRQALPTMTSARSIPIDPSTAYVMTAADVVVHPARYMVPDKSMAETIALARSRHSASDDKQLATLCMIDDGSVTLQDCQEVSARNTAQMIVNGEVAAYDVRLYNANFVIPHVTRLAALPVSGKTPVEFLDAACNRMTTAFADACYHLAFDYEVDGNGVVVNEYKARDFYEAGCNLHSQISCVDFDRIKKKFEGAERLIKIGDDMRSIIRPMCLVESEDVKAHCKGILDSLREQDYYYSIGQLDEMVVYTRMANSHVQPLAELVDRAP